MADTATGVTGGPVIAGYSGLRLISRGSTAKVYRAVQDKLRRQVAIKVLRVDDVMTTWDQVRQELETTVSLSSQPHIVSIIDTGTTDGGRPYIVMEYCEDGSYAYLLSQRGPLPVDEIVDVGIKIADALQAAHQVGIIHRDVKPHNILRSRFGPALTDFGIARATNDLSGTITLNKLTPHHAAPESLLRQQQGPASDVYSLASTMWNLLAGYPPFGTPGDNNPDPFEYRDRALRDPVPLVPRPDIPGWLQDELIHAMAKSPTDRHQSAAAFDQALRQGWSRGTGQLWTPPAAYPPVGVAPEQPAAGATTGSPSTGFDTPAPSSGVPGTRPTATPAAGSGAPLWPAAAPGGGEVASALGPLVSAQPVPAADFTTPSADPSGSPSSAPPASDGYGATPGFFGTPSSAPPAQHGAPSSAPPAPNSAPPAQYGAPSSAPPAQYGAPNSAAPAQFGAPSSAPPAAFGAPSSAPPAAFGAPSSAPPAGYGTPASAPPAYQNDPFGPVRGPEILPPGAAPAGWQPTPTGNPADEPPKWRTQRRRRVGPWPFVAAALVGVLLGVGALVAYHLSAGNSGSPKAGGASATPSTAPTASADPSIKPTNVKLTDHQVSVTLTWTDNTKGKASYLVLGGPIGQTMARVSEAAPTTTREIDGLNDTVDYCFRVMAVVTVDDIGVSDSVCTNRGHTD